MLTAEYPTNADSGFSFIGTRYLQCKTSNLIHHMCVCTFVEIKHNITKSINITLPFYDFFFIPGRLIKKCTRKEKFTQNHCELWNVAQAIYTLDMFEFVK